MLRSVCLDRIAVGVQSAEPTEPRQYRQADILDQREIQENALAQPIASEQRDPRGQRSGRVSAFYRLAFNQYAAGGLARRRPEYRARELAESGSRRGL